MDMTLDEIDAWLAAWLEVKEEISEAQRDEIERQSNGK